MNPRKKIFGISGSTRQQSSNQLLLQAIGDFFATDIDLEIFDGLASIPAFDPDQLNGNDPAVVKLFREKIAGADGVIICTPEYAHGVPGSLKNAIDWTVGSGEFSHKPTVLITASTDGRFGHQAMLDTLRVIEAENIDQLELLVSFIKTKIGGDGKIRDEKTRDEVIAVVTALLATIRSASDNV
ncbi:MAG: NADPH-dependent FMN reductase [Chitinophagaceae bacterium]